MYNKIFLTGANGFVGKNISSFLKGRYQINSYNRNQVVSINENIVIHLAGKAHDLKNITRSDEYYQVNTELTKTIFDAFLASEAEVFISLSSVKSVADELNGILLEEHIPNPITHYGKSKQLAEQYILSKPIPKGKRVYILRPCMIHGPGNKGNLNLLYKVVSKGFPWPLGAFENKRSFCSIDNLCFVIQELIAQIEIPSGIYNVSDDVPLSTNEIIQLISEIKGSRLKILKMNKSIISKFAQFGDLFKLPLNSERLNKLTENYIVSNEKIKSAIGKNLPVSSKQGLLKTFNSFSI
jgi:nucleoside-diphosphate-sugar epimerase